MKESRELRKRMKKKGIERSQNKRRKLKSHTLNAIIMYLKDMLRYEAKAQRDLFEDLCVL